MHTRETIIVGDFGDATRELQRHGDLAGRLQGRLGPLAELNQSTGAGGVATGDAQFERGRFVMRSFPIYGNAILRLQAEDDAALLDALPALVAHFGTAAGVPAPVPAAEPAPAS